MNEKLNTITFKHFGEHLNLQLRDIIEIKIKDEELKFMVTDKFVLWLRDDDIEETYIMKEYVESGV